MKKKNGFIATSLIYSFFLVFLSVLLATLNGYLVNDRILSRYNKGIRETIDKKSLIPMIYSPQNCYIQKDTDKHFLEVEACFKIFNNHNKLIPTDNIDKYNVVTLNYKCTINPCTMNADDDECVENGASSITTMNVKEWGEGTYKATCAIKNDDIDSRFIYSSTTTVHIVNNLNP